MFRLIQPQVSFRVNNKKDDNKPLLEMQKFTYKILLDTMITDNLL